MTAHRRPALALTPLEDRSTPTVTHSFAAGVLTITGDGANDTIQVVRANTANDYYYLGNGVKSVTFTGVTAINADGGAGGDAIDASRTATPIPYVSGKTAVVATSSYNVNYLPIWAVNGAGLSGDTHTATMLDGYGGQTMWLTTNQSGNLNGVKGQFIQMDLGDSYNLGKLQIWNYNQQWTPAVTVRGIKSADVLLSNDGTNFTTALSNVTLTQATGTDTYNTPDTVYLPGAPAARYVRILVNSNFAADGYGNYVGLSEVKLFGEPTNPTLQGPKVDPVGVSATSTHPAMDARNAANGYGLNPFFPQYHDTNWYTAWMTDTLANVAGKSITFDLGAVQTLGRMHVWNYNQVYGTKYTGRGIKNADIQFSSDNVTFTTVLSPVLNEASGSSIEAGQDVTLPATATRYVRIVVQSNWNNNVADAYGNYAGLSEVKFYGTASAPPLPLGVTITGGANDDLITAGAGTDTMTGATGIDTFIFTPTFAQVGSKQATVTDFTNLVDKLDLRPLGVTSLTSLTSAGGSAAQVGADTVITIPPAYGARTIKLNGFLTVLLDNSDFVP